MITIRITEEARLDLDDGFWFYEDQEPGIGEYFADCLRQDIAKLEKFAGNHPKVYRDVFRYFSERFPFGIYYRFDSRIATIIAVMDCRRDPDWIELHLRRR